MTPLFVLGVPRSGTTLLRSLIGTFEGVYLPPDEFQILPLILRDDFDQAALPQVLKYSNFADHMRRRHLWPPVHDLERICLGQTPAQAFADLVACIAKADGQDLVRYFGDKTPENIFHMDLILKTWPNAKIIHIHRDPRDVVLSMSQSWGRSLLRASVMWRDGLAEIERIKNSPHGDQIYELPYETLTLQPNQELEKLATWLGEKFDPKQLSAFQSEERWSISKHIPGIQNRSGAWKEKLTPKQIRQIEQICFKQMQQAGYKPAYASSHISVAPLWLKVTRPIDGMRLLLTYMRDRGWKNAIWYKLRQWRQA